MMMCILSFFGFEQYEFGYIFLWTTLAKNKHIKQNFFYNWSPFLVLSGFAGRFEHLDCLNLITVGVYNKSMKIRNVWLNYNQSEMYHISHTVPDQWVRCGKIKKASKFTVATMQSWLVTMLKQATQTQAITNGNQNRPNDLLYYNLSGRLI